MRKGLEHLQHSLQEVVLGKKVKEGKMVRGGEGEVVEEGKRKLAEKRERGSKEGWGEGKGGRG